MRSSSRGTLRLHKETLRALTTTELGRVGGGDSTGSDGNKSPGTGSCSNLTTSCGCGGGGGGGGGGFSYHIWICPISTVAL